MTQSHKKVIVRTLTGDPIAGYINPKAFVHRAATSTQLPVLTLDVLDLDGRTLLLSLEEVRLICFVRDFNRDDLINPERLTRRSFLSRPRAEGLWLRLTFTGGDQIEGLASPDLTLLDALIEDAGVFLTPPDERANTHRIYVPRTAITDFEVLAVISAPSRKTQPARKPTPDQPTLFPS